MAAQAKAASSRGATPNMKPQKANEQRRVLTKGAPGPKLVAPEKVAELKRKLGDYVEELPPNVGQKVSELTRGIVKAHAETLRSATPITPAVGADALVQDDRHKLDHWLKQWQPVGFTSLVKTDGVREVKLANGETITVAKRVDPYDPVIAESRVHPANVAHFYYREVDGDLKLQRVVTFGTPHSYENHTFVPCGNVVWVGKTQAEDPKAWAAAKASQLGNTNRSKDRRSREHRVQDTVKLNAVQMSARLQRAPTVAEMVANPQRWDWNINSIKPTGLALKQYGEDVRAQAEKVRDWQLLQKATAHLSQGQPLSKMEAEILRTKGLLDAPTPVVVSEKAAAEVAVTQDDVQSPSVRAKPVPKVAPTVFKGEKSWSMSVDMREDRDIIRLPSLEFLGKRHPVAHVPQAVVPAPAEVSEGTIVAPKKVNKGKEKRLKKLLGKQRAVERREYRAQKAKVRNAEPMIVVTNEVHEKTSDEMGVVTPSVTPEQRWDVGAEAETFLWAAHQEDGLDCSEVKVHFELLDKGERDVVYSNTLRGIPRDRVKAGLQVMQGLKPLPEKGKPEADPVLPVPSGVPVPFDSRDYEQVDFDEKIARAINSEQEWLHELRGFQLESQRKLQKLRFDRVAAQIQLAPTVAERAAAAVRLTRLGDVAGVEVAGLLPAPRKPRSVAEGDLYQKGITHPNTYDANVLREKIGSKMKRLQGVYADHYKVAHKRDVRVTEVWVGSYPSNVVDLFSDGTFFMPPMFIHMHKHVDETAEFGHYYDTEERIALLYRRLITRQRKWGTWNFNAAHVREQVAAIKSRIAGPPSRFVKWACKVGDVTHTFASIKTKKIAVTRMNGDQSTSVHYLYEGSKLQKGDHPVHLKPIKVEKKPSLFDQIFAEVRRSVTTGKTSRIVELKDVKFREALMKRTDTNVYNPSRNMRIALRNLTAICNRYVKTDNRHDARIREEEARHQSWLATYAPFSAGPKVVLSTERPRLRSAPPRNIELITEISTVDIGKQFVDFTNQLKKAGVEITNDDVKSIILGNEKPRPSKAVPEYVMIDGVPYKRQA